MRAKNTRGTIEGVNGNHLVQPEAANDKRGHDQHRSQHRQHPSAPPPPLLRRGIGAAKYAGAAVAARGRRIVGGVRIALVALHLEGLPVPAAPHAPVSHATPDPDMSQAVDGTATEHFSSVP